MIRVFGGGSSSRSGPGLQGSCGRYQSIIRVVYARLCAGKNADVLDGFLIDFLISLMFDIEFEKSEECV